MPDQPKGEKPAPAPSRETAPVGKDVTYRDWAMI